MAKTLLDVQNEYENYKSQNPGSAVDMQSFAKQMDEVQGAPERQAAYDPHWYNKLNALVDRGFEATHLPDVTGAVGSGLGGLIDTAAGTHVQPTLETLGRDVPRMTAESLLTIPEAASGAGLPVAVGTWANRLRRIGQVVGYGDAALKGYDQTGSPVGAAISAGSMGVANKLLLPAEMGGIDVGKGPAAAVSKWLERGTPDFNPATMAARDALGEAPLVAGPTGLAGRLPDLVHAGTQVAAATALNEATRQAEMSVGPNAVGITDPARNPFTQENVASAVGGAAFFTPQIFQALKSRPVNSPKQTTQLQEWLATKDAAAKEAQGQLPIKNAGEGITFGDQEGARDPHQALYGILRTSLDAAAGADAMGNTAEADTHRANALATIDEMASGRYGTPPPEMLENVKSIVDSEAMKAQATSDPAKFGEFVSQVKSIVDTLNEGNLKFQDELASREETLNRNDKKAVAEHNAWVASQQANKGKSWHPEARDPSVLDRLWKSGDLQPLTPEWLEKEYNASFDQSGNPQFATQVVAQKVANYALDHINVALERESVKRKAVTEFSPAVQKYNDVDMQFAKALTSLPPEVRDAVVQRSVELRRYGNFQPGQAERMGITEGTRVKPSGEVLSPYLPWQKAVINAASSYKPETGAILLRSRGQKGYAWSPIETLVKKDASGKYVWEPNEQTVAPALGGKSSTKIRDESGKPVKQFETNIENIPTKEGQDSIGAHDEEEFKAALGTASQEPVVAGDFGSIHLEGDVRPADETREMPAEPTKGENALGERLAEKSVQLNKTLDSLTDAQVWNLVRQDFKLKDAGVKGDSRAGDIKLAIRAAMDTLAAKKDQGLGEYGRQFLEQQKAKGLTPVPGEDPRRQARDFLRRYFQSGESVFGASGKLEPHEERLARIVKKLLDPKTVERAKTEGPKAQKGVDEPLVEYAAPLRLRRWMNGEYKISVTPDALGRIPAKSVDTVLTKLGVTKDEMALYKAAGIDAFVGGKNVGVEELAGWMEANTPKVEVKKLQPWLGESSKFHEAQHLLESQGFHVDENHHVFPPAAYGTDSIPGTEEAIRLYGERIGNAVAAIYSEPKDAFEAQGDAATGRYGVEPKELKDMPGAVDILVRVPARTKAEDALRAKVPYSADLTEEDLNKQAGVPNRPTLYQGPHFGQSDVNVLASVRGYVETLPSGEKVFHVFEVQSDWGQSIQKAKGEIEAGPERPAQNYLRERISKDHPLLAVYEQLALKAAIVHAREIGAKYVAVSDAETAMMTEGHDRSEVNLPQEHLVDTTQEKDAAVKLLQAKGTFVDAQYDNNVSKWRIWERATEPKQAPGMRAAYDVRLPNAMEKLTGDKGKPVNFGPHKSGSPVFTERDAMGEQAPKLSTTARLYDITKAPDQFAAFGYTKPASEGTTTEPTHTLVNEPREGAFVGDVAQTFRAFVDKTLGRAGYSGTSKEFFTEVAVSLARNLPNLDLYRLVGKDSTHGMAGIPGMTEQPASERGKLGLNFDRKVAPGQEFAAAQQLLATLAHEITHMHGYIRDGLIPKPDAYSDEMGRTYTNLEHLVTNLTPDEREGMMNVLNESLPASFRKLREDGMKPLGTMDPDEFLAEVTSKVTLLLANDTAAGRAAAMERLDYAPTELREFAQNTFRTVNDTLAAMQSALKAGTIYSANTDPFILDKGFQAVIGSAKYMSAMRDADRQLTLARSAISSMSPKGMNTPPPRITDSVWFTGQKDLAKYQRDVPEVSPTSVDAVNEVHKQVFSPTAYDAAHTPNAFARWFYPFSNLMVNMERQGIPLARPVLDMVLSLEPGISRLYSGMMSEFMKRNTDGSVDFNQQNPLVHTLSTEKTGPTRDAINAVSKWQQENKTQSMFIVDEKSGTIMANPDAKGATEKWNAIRSQLSKESQQLVMGASVSLDKANQLAAGYLVKHIADSNVGHVATYLMAANKGMTYDVAQARAAQIMDAYLTKNQMALSKILPEDQLQAIDRLLVGNKDGLLPKFLEVKTLLENRPGFRSESLPHDWIIKYKDGDATRYTSAPTEKQAEYVANRLKASGKQQIGEILNKRDYNSMQEFDHPDAILAKVAETENFVWQRFVNEMTTQHGEELGKELTEGFSPVAQSLKDFGTAGLNKFLRERRQLVDRENFDYVDGTFAYLDRLSKSLGIRTVQQQVRLILNDPRARLLPSFQKLVREHVSEMMQPTSRAAQQMKTFVSTNFLGMNIGGALVNGTQSISTLVPHLITGVDTRYVPTGGTVKAWKDMFSAMGKAVDYTVTKDWERTASSVKDIDPTKWDADQSQAALYKRHLEGGGINQTVVDDLMYGRDKNMLMNAKFGSGDYGPVPTSKLVSDKMYMASQMMMYLYKGVEHFNAKTAFLSGIRQGHELGLRGNELYDYGVRMQALATFGGGRANAPGVAGARWAKSGENGARSAVGLVNSLQQYGYGVLSMYAQLGKDSIGRSSGLNAVQVRQAQKAFGTMLMTQVAVAGALGLPFVGASLTLLEQVFGIPANQAVRQGLASLGGDDTEVGSTIAETALNGAANQLSGLDLSSRLGTSNLFGTSSYRGFNVQDMVGPAGSIVGNMVNALNYFSQNKPAEAFHEIVPQAFKNAVELSNTKAKYGTPGMRDAAGNLMYTPTPGEQTAYTLGFRPKELSQKRAMQSMLTAADMRSNQRQDNQLDVAAQSLTQGDPTPTQRLIADMRAHDQTLDPRDIMRQVMDRSVAMQSEKDLLASGSRYDEQERLDIAKTFGPDVNTRRSEVDLQNLRMTMAQALGDPRVAPTLESYKQAAIVDSLVQQQGMPRSQAVRLLGFLHGKY